MTPPARQRLPAARHVARVHPHEGGRAGAAVQVLVAAADGEVGLRAAPVDRHRARAVAQVPDHQRAGGMRGGGDGSHVVHGAGAVVDVGEHQHGHVGRQAGGHLVRFDQLQRAAALAAQGLGDVQVGGEVAALADDGAAAGCVLRGNVQRRRQHLVEVDRGGVGGHHLTPAGADERGDAVAHAARQREPAGAVPALDQVLPPLLRHHVRHARGHGAGQGAERVAVEVDHARRQIEQVAQRAQGVIGVALAAVLLRDHGVGFFKKDSCRRFMDGRWRPILFTMAAAPRAPARRRRSSVSGAGR